jgi:hypothetical protein
VAPDEQRRRRGITPQRAAEWSLIAPVAVGVFGLLVILVVYVATLIITGHGVTEPALLTTFGGLLAVGQGTQALAALRTPPPDADEARHGD